MPSRTEESMPHIATIAAIEIAASESDDVTFLELVRRIVNGALADMLISEVYLVHIDNWFDHKWLLWWSSGGQQELTKLCVPPVNPNRVRSQMHFIRDTVSSLWNAMGAGKALHVRQPGRRSQRKLLDQISESAAFVWYSGNTLKNRTGSVMFYQSGAGDYAWYASFSKKEIWKIDDGFRITRRELASFEQRGRQLE
jgi:hypothetical protein